MGAIGIEALGLGGYGIISTRIHEILGKYPSEVAYDEISDSARATVTIYEGQSYPVISGRTLTPGTYIFWYENERSITAKLQLIHKYNLKGSGIWSLGQETSDTWNYYGRVANGEETINDGRVQNEGFYDVDANYWAHDAIYLAKEKSWVSGRSEHYFEPEGTLTRAEFATLICRILGYTYANIGDFYLDICNHWARNNINAVSMAKLMNGYNNGLFYPDKEITREEVAKVLYYLIRDKVGGKEVAFSDVASDRWSYEYIQKLSSLGIVNGYDNGTFQPQNPIKRSEIVTILQRMFD